MGEGGFGSVFLAHDSEAGALCALKIFKLMPLEKIEREIALTQSFDHNALLHGIAGKALTGVLREGDNTLSKNESYLATELATNGDLYQFLSLGKVFPERIAQAIFVQLLDALEYMHMRGFVHLDIKPENVFVDGEYRTKLGDFGLAQPIGGEDGEGVFTNERCGSPHYWAPEVV